MHDDLIKQKQHIFVKYNDEIFNVDEILCTFMTNSWNYIYDIFVDNHNMSF